MRKYFAVSNGNKLTNAFVVVKRSMWGVAIFAKACFGHPSPSKRQKLNATTNAFGGPRRPAYVPLRHYHRKLGAGFVTLPQMTGRRFGMPFILSTPTLALRFRQNNGPTPSGDYQPSLSLSMAGSEGLLPFLVLLHKSPFPTLSAIIILNFNKRWIICSASKALTFQKMSFFMLFYFMSGMTFRIATLKKCGGEVKVTFLWKQIP
ncbi:hypothetical protein BJAS_P4315 [Bathymodiolus japonicus methanotrophic gill symbiont]|nr:hypothetical protein BJAS_P4315 [Bathymodiolus japonicus methanotrophic gill symbiont]